MTVVPNVNVALTVPALVTSVLLQPEPSAELVVLTHEVDSETNSSVVLHVVLVAEPEKLAVVGV